MNPITALVTIIFAAVAVLLFLMQQFPAAIGIGILAVFTAYSLKMANNWERFVILRAGKLSSVKGPGLFVIIPIIDSITAVSGSGPAYLFLMRSRRSRATRSRSTSMPSCSGTCTTRSARRSTSPTIAARLSAWRRPRCVR